MKKINKREIVFIISTILLAISTVVLSVLLCVKKDKPENLQYYDEKCEMFKLENANFAHGQIIFIGDSITDGCALDVFYNDLPLAKYNRGIGGDSTSGVLNRLKISLFDIKPSKIVLMIGVNDINSNVSKNKILENYQNILSEISANLPTTQVYCVSILPINKMLEDYTPINVESSTELILEINPEIQNLAGQFGYEFVNMYPHFADSNNFLIESLTPDGIHLNSNGYTVYSNLLKPYLM